MGCGVACLRTLLVLCALPLLNCACVCNPTKYCTNLNSYNLCAMQGQTNLNDPFVTGADVCPEGCPAIIAAVYSAHCWGIDIECLSNVMTAGKDVAEENRRWQLYNCPQQLLCGQTNTSTVAATNSAGGGSSLSTDLVVVLVVGSVVVVGAATVFGVRRMIQNQSARGVFPHHLVPALHLPSATRINPFANNRPIRPQSKVVKHAASVFNSGSTERSVVMSNFATDDTPTNSAPIQTTFHSDLPPGPDMAELQCLSGTVALDPFLEDNAAAHNMHMQQQQLQMQEHPQMQMREEMQMHSPAFEPQLPLHHQSRVHIHALDEHAAVIQWHGLGFHDTVPAGTQHHTESNTEDDYFTSTAEDHQHNTAWKPSNYVEPDDVYMQ